MNQKKIIIYIACILFGIFFVPIFFWFNANISVYPSQQDLQCWSDYNFNIILNTSWENVIASDIKFFLQWLSLSGLTTLTWFDQINYIGTGVSTKWQNIGRTYHYINVYQNSFGNPITGNNIQIANITVIPISGNANGSIEFYNLFGNDEDSNIAVWIEYWTEWYPIRYNDFLLSTTDGNYSLSGCVVSSWPISGWWWNPIMIKDDCELPSNLPWANDQWIDNSPSYYDGTCQWESWHEIINYCGIGKTNFSEEMIDAFQFSYGLGITTMCPIENARLDGYILRKELAKVMTEFTTKVLWIYPDLNKSWCDKYNDIVNESKEFQFYMKTACQLNIMWLHENGITPKKSFDPNEYVNRAQLGTVLSRLIFGWKYNITGDNADYSNKNYRFKNHLEALKRYAIMKNISDPYMTELRWYVFIMLQRIYDNWLVEKYRPTAAAKNWITALLNN